MPVNHDPNFVDNMPQNMSVFFKGNDGCSV